ncbi:hypothetical protein [Acidianus brierleyi]|uniref:Uncharacterized protein n=1 Tax=Acidianus brierleyi TaxID=41673 RepID=A0A2U9IBW5_9CREN|nr:hypothetical protein [Acidianus brierleyi]AWR93511.1 hypothetical protein DFR85_01675 [Acidianus brierleyi]
MEINIYYGKEHVSIKDQIVTLTGSSDRYQIDRAVYYILKTLYSMPRLYGISIKDNILEAWKKEFEIKFLDILKSDMELERIKFNNMRFEINTDKISIEGNLDTQNIFVKVKLLDIPDVENSLSGLVKLDSYYFNSIPKLKPYIILGNRSGLIAAFHKFLILHNEGTPGIPKTLGIVSEFINSIVIPEGVNYDIFGNELTSASDGIMINNVSGYNASPDTLSLFPLKFLLETSNGYFIIEDPEANLSNEFKVKLINLIKNNKSKLIISTNDKDFMLGNIITISHF